MQSHVPGFSHSHLFHDGILWVFALHDAGLNEVPDAVIAAASSQDGEVGRLLGVLDPLLYTCKRLRKEENERSVELGGEKESWAMSFGAMLLFAHFQLRRKAASWKYSPGHSEPYLCEGFSTNNPLLKRGSDTQYS